MIHQENTLGFDPEQPVVAMEGRAPLPEQTITRQTYLPEVLAGLGVQTLYVRPKEDVYNSRGLLRAYQVYDPHGEPRVVELPDDQGIRLPAWRLRDTTWAASQDPQAFAAGHGHNSAALRRELATRPGMLTALGAMGLAEEMLAGTVVRPGDELDTQGAKFVFIKPLAANDISENQPGQPPLRAQFVRASEAATVLSQDFSGAALLQPAHPSMHNHALLSAFGIRRPAGVATFSPVATHAIRLYQPLWAAASDPAAIELRLSRARDIGTSRMASELYLVSPAHLRLALPGVVALHSRVHAALLERYSEDNNPGIDYLVQPDGEPKIVNVQSRPLTPNLEGHADVLQARRARAAANVEAGRMAHKARLAHAQGFRLLD